MSIIGASRARDDSAAQVPEYSPPPVTIARHAPFQACGDLLADHEPLSRILPEGSRSVQAPVTPPLSGWAWAVQVPAKARPLEDALHVPRSSAAGAIGAKRESAETNKLKHVL